MKKKKREKIDNLENLRDSQNHGGKSRLTSFGRAVGAANKSRYSDHENKESTMYPKHVYVLTTLFNSILHDAR